MRAESGTILRELLEFGDRTAAEAMVPRVRVVGIPVGASASRVREIILQHHHTRYPIYDADPEHEYLRDVVVRAVGISVVDGSLQKN